MFKTGAINQTLPIFRLFGGACRGRSGDLSVQGICVPNYTKAPLILEYAVGFEPTTFTALQAVPLDHLGTHTFILVFPRRIELLPIDFQSVMRTSYTTGTKMFMCGVSDGT